MFPIVAAKPRRWGGRRGLLNVKRLGAGDLAARIRRDLVDARLGLPQQFFAAALESLAALVDCDRFFQRHLAVLESLHNRLKLLDSKLESEVIDVVLGVFGPIAFPDAPSGPPGAESSL